MVPLEEFTLCCPLSVFTLKSVFSHFSLTSHLVLAMPFSVAALFHVG
jgi:hypothetical protein